MKIYDLNMKCIKRDKTKFRKILFLEERFRENNSELKKAADEYLKNNNNKIVIRYNNKFYIFKKSSVNTGNNSDYCNDCDFQKECHGKLEICICETLFKDGIEINLKEIEEYEIVFGDDYNENL